MAENKGDARRSGTEENDAEGSGEGKSAKPRSMCPLIILAVVVVVAAIAGFFVWFARRNLVSTDDAYTDGNVVVMAPKVSGYVVVLLVDDNTRVRKGDLLLRIDPRDYLTARDNASAQLALAKAQLKTAEDSLQIARVQYPAQLLAAEAQQASAAAASALAQGSSSRP